MNLLPVEKIEEYFFEYINDEDTKIVTFPGFKKYLIAVKKWNKDSLRDMKQRLSEDIDLLHLIKAYCEGDLIDKSLLGMAHATMTQFVLKKHHGYDSIEQEDYNKAQEIKISIDPKSVTND
jgi:hypothetical protein